MKTLFFQSTMLIVILALWTFISLLSRVVPGLSIRYYDRDLIFRSERLFKGDI